MDLGPAELAIILLIVVMVFGSARLKDLGGSLGQGIKEFRAAVREEDDVPAAVPPAPTASVATATVMPVDEVAGAVTCPSCGAANLLRAKHCSQCGVAIAAPVS